MSWKFEKEFREAHPETIGETDKAFDLENYKDWLEEQVVKNNAVLQHVVGRSEQLCVDCNIRTAKIGNQCISCNHGWTKK